MENRKTSTGRQKPREWRQFVAAGDNPQLRKPQVNPKPRERRQMQRMTKLGFLSERSINVLVRKSN